MDKKKLQTARFGEIEYTKEDVITFEKGLPGFEKEKKFIIVQPDKENPLAFLQSELSLDLAFVITNPFMFIGNYEFEIDDITKEELKLENIEDISVYGILSVPEDFKNTTINLQAPLIINNQKKLGKQIIIQSTNYNTKTPLFQKVIKEGGK